MVPVLRTHPQLQRPLPALPPGRPGRRATGGRRSGSSTSAESCARSSAVLSGGEPLVYPNLGGLVRLLKARCAPLRVFLNTNGALLTPARFAELVEAGVDEVLISLDYPDERHDAFRAIPGLFARIQGLVTELPPRERRRVVLTTVFPGRQLSGGAAYRAPRPRLGRERRTSAPTRRCGRTTGA